jgi:hypothetical protein
MRMVVERLLIGFLFGERVAINIIKVFLVLIAMFYRLFSEIYANRVVLLTVL